MRDLNVFVLRCFVKLIHQHQGFISQLMIHVLIHHWKMAQARISYQRFILRKQQMYAFNI